MKRTTKQMIVGYCEAIINECKKDFTSPAYVEEKMRYLNSYIADLEN